MKWITGREVVKNYGMTTLDLFDLVTIGQITPWVKDRTFWPDPTNPPGVKRLVPYAHEKAYNRLTWWRYQRAHLQKQMDMSDEEHIERQAHYLGAPKEVNGGGLKGLALQRAIWVYAYEMPEYRVGWTDEIRRYCDQIPQLEADLHPAKVWRDDWSPQDQEYWIEQFLLAWYLIEEVDAADGS